MGIKKDDAALLRTQGNLRPGQTEPRAVTRTMTGP